MQLENHWGFYGENVKNHRRTLKMMCLSRLRVGEERSMSGKNVFYSI